MFSKKRILAGILAISTIVQLVFCVNVFAAAADKYEYEPGNFILDRSNTLSWKNPTSDKLQTVSVYMISDDGTETDVSKKLTAVTPAGVTAAANTPSAIVKLPGASNSEERACNCSLIFSFSDGTVRNLIIGDTYDKSALFIQKGQSATLDPNNSGEYLSVDLYQNDKAAAKASLSNTVVKSGGTALKIESNNVESEYFSVSFKGLIINTSYHVSMQINTIEESEYNFDGVTITLPNTGGEWKTLEFDYNMGSSPYFKIMPVGASREVYFDDISFTVKGESNAYLVMGFETRNVSAPTYGMFETVDTAVGDGAVKLKWEEQRTTAPGYINVYEKDVEKGLLLRARLKTGGSSQITLSGFINDKRYTFCIKNQGSSIVWGYGLETDGIIVDAIPHLYKDKQNIVLNIEKQADELNSLVRLCDARKINPSYEIADVNFVNLYANRLRRMYESFQYDDFEYYAEKVTAVYNDVRSKLDDIINGKIDYREVPEYRIAGNEMKDGSIVIRTSENGEKPFVGIGFSAFYTDINDLEDMASLGIRAIQFDSTNYGPSTFLIYDENLQDYVKNTELADQYLAELRSELDLCREKGIMVDIHPPIQYSVDVSSMKGASDYRSVGGDYGSFINFNPTSDTAKKMIKKYYEIYMPLVYEYKDIVTSITFVNEPSFDAWDKSYYFERWTNYLEEKYQNVQNLNSVYGTNYSSIDDVKMPEYIPSRDENNDGMAWSTPIHMDYRLFITDILCEFYDFCIEEINKYTNGEIPCGVKTMQFMREYMSKWKNGRNREISFDYETMMQHLDYNGMDAFSYYLNSYHEREENITLPAKLSWYDFTTSLKDAPILDTEAHVILDDADATQAGIQVEDFEMLPDYTSASVWMGAMHGCDLAAVWMYADTEHKPDLQNAFFLRHPDALRKMSHTALDARRLSEEIDAIQNKKRDIAVLYSYESFMYNLQYQSNLFTAYNILTQKGQRPLYVTDKTIDKLSNCKLLIIAGNLIANENTIDAISEYVSNGGKVIFIGEDCFNRDISNKQLTDKNLLTKIKALKDKSTIIKANLLNDTAKSDFAENAGDVVEASLNELGLMNVRLIDKDTDKTADVEWNAAEYRGNTLISACNYSDNPVTVQVEMNGVIRVGIDDIKNDQFSLSDVTLKPYVPVLLRVSDVKYDISLLNSLGSKVYKIEKGVTYSAVASVSNYESDDSENVRLIAALYCDDELVDAFITEAIIAEKSELKKQGYINGIKIPEISDKEYVLKLMLWDDKEECRPLQKVKFIRE